jgi:tetraacyldisaccharide 4'-kinase
VITRNDRAPALETAIRRHSGAPIFYARPGLDSVRTFRGAESREESLAGHDRKYFAFCGIGNPSAFLTDLREWGFQVAGHTFFPDHHRYTPGDARAIEIAAQKAGANALICTEKDIFNLSGAGTLAFDVFYCRISMRIDREQEFWRAVTTVAESRTSLPHAATK